MTRGAGQVAEGKPAALFVEGGVRIASSIANFAQWIGEHRYNLHGIYASLGGTQHLMMLLQRCSNHRPLGGLESTRGEKCVTLAKYVGQQELFGFKINLDGLKRDAPSFSPAWHARLPEGGVVRLRDTGTRGIFLVLDGSMASHAARSSASSSRD